MPSFPTRAIPFFSMVRAVFSDIEARSMNSAPSLELDVSHGWLSVGITQSCRKKVEYAFRRSRAFIGGLNHLHTKMLTLEGARGIVLGFIFSTLRNLSNFSHKSWHKCLTVQPSRTQRGYIILCSLRPGPAWGCFQFASSSSSEEESIHAEAVREKPTNQILAFHVPPYVTNS